MAEPTQSLNYDTQTNMTTKYKGSKRATLALLISVITLGAVGYLYYVGLKTNAANVSQLQALEKQLQNYEYYAASIENLNQHVNKLNDQVESITREADSYRNKKNLINYQINELISLANQSLLIFHDVRTAVKILNYVKDIIKGNNNALYIELKAAITNDISKLEQLNTVDIALTASQLDTMVNQINNLKTYSSNLEIPKGTQLGSTETTSKWKQFLNNVKTKLLGLVKVSTYADNNRLELLPDQEAILLQNIRLDLLSAKVALLQGNGDIWQVSLKGLETKLNKYFVKDNNLEFLNKQVDNLKKMEINTSNANLDEVLKALNKLNDLSSNKE